MTAPWIVFDAMGVIFEVGDDTIDLLAPYLLKRSSTLVNETIQAEYIRLSLGQISAFDFWNLMGFGSAYPAIQKDYLDTCLTLDPAFLPAARELSGQYSLAVLSNDASEWSSHLRTHFGLDAWIRAAVISGSAGYRKPSDEIYQILFNTICASPSDCVFIDDRESNLLTAARLGMKPVRFLRPQDPHRTTQFESIRSFTELPALVARIFKVSSA